ncbi:hypothetical protein JCM18899A_33050 [Nocardioides sp. AN3]
MEPDGGVWLAELGRPHQRHLAYRRDEDGIAEGDDHFIERAPDATTRGWRGSEAVLDEDELILPLGRISAHAIRFGNQPRTPGAEKVETGWGLFEAADAISQGLASTVCPMLDVNSPDMFIEEVLEVIEDEYVDEILVMDETELDPQARRRGIGAWADARVITALAPSASTLIVAKAAPLHRADFLPEGADTRREFTAEESAAWHQGQQSLWTYWSQTLGLPSRQPPWAAGRPRRHKPSAPVHPW